MRMTRPLARSPMSDMDPDGDYVSQWLGTRDDATPITLIVSETDAALLQQYVH